MGSRWKVLVGACLALGMEAVADDGIVFLHPPDQSGGSISDTAFNDLSRRLADDFLLRTDATIRQIVWWGGYGGIVPPVSETMRIRIYTPDEGSGLPGTTLFETTIVNPVRVPTGLLVTGGGGQFPEFSYHVDIAAPLALNSSTSYWLEIVQIGDPISTFFWELSAMERNGFAASFPSDLEWQTASFGKDLAFHLSTVPEPGALAFGILAAGVAGRRARRTFRH